MPKKSPITITDVAKTAGVAVGTVSRVFNNHADVNAEIRERVWHTARKLGYSRLRQRKSEKPPTNHSGGHDSNIAVIFFGMEDTLVQLPVVSFALQGIESALSTKGRSLMLANIPRGDRVPPFLTENRVEGLILKGPNQGDLPAEAESELLRNIYRFPHVWLMGRLQNGKGDHCNFDTEVAGRLAADHLFEKGHRRVAFMNPKPGQTQFEKVKAAFNAAAARHDMSTTALEVDPPDAVVWPLPAITFQTNVDRLAKRWSTLPIKTRPTALFVPSDRTAVQLYSSLERLGLRVGTDVSVVSCNNEKPLIGNLHPELTTIDVHADFIGRRAVDQLLWRIKHPDEKLAVQIIVEPTLVERSSVATL
jgi:LacI family transcriptional regulator